ncbi:MAG TPA: 8-oxo-dGTP diphosphatase [Anaerolineae bacterium]
MPRTEQGIDVSLKRNRYTAIPRTLCFITRGRDEVLLLRGAPTKRIWANRYNGIGGHVEPDEDILSSMARELREETGLTVGRLALRGIVNVNTGDSVGIIVFVFSAEYTSGEVRSSEEGALEWVQRDRLASLPLAPDLPAILARIFDAAPNTPPFFAYTHYDENDQLVIEFADAAN